MQTDQDKHTKETNKIAKSEKIVWRRHAKEQNTPTRNIANKFDVPVTQVLPVHPVEHWHPRALFEKHIPKMVSLLLTPKEV